VARGGITYGSAADNAFDNFNLSTLTYQQANDLAPPTISSMNRCTASYSKLLPSTVYAPGPYAKNDGKWLGKQWVRYERFLALDNSRVASFPSSTAGDLAQRIWRGPHIGSCLLERQYRHHAQPPGHRARAHANDRP
jgi:hypothetical protein